MSTRSSYLFLITLALAALGLIGCHSADFDIPVYPYTLDPSIKKTPIKTVMIAPINIGLPSRLYLQKHEAHIDEMVKTYLRDHDFSILPEEQFTQYWLEAIHQFGDPYDPTSGRRNENTFKQALIYTVNKLNSAEKIDAIIFTDLIEVKTAFTTGFNHVARWHGVARNPRLQGAGDGVTEDFSWSQSVDAVSLEVSILNPQLQGLFQSVGGIELTQAIDLKASKPDFVRARTVLSNDGFIQEGIAIAFHPLIEYADYPKH